jgi:hypothetical protein
VDPTLSPIAPLPTRIRSADALDRPGATFRVLYIGGAGRSGSTLLDRLLGQFPGVCAVGEVVHLWRRGVVGNELCGCGVPFRRCGFWSDVGRQAFGGWDASPADEVLALERTVGRHRFIPLLLSPGVAPAFDARAARYRELQRRLYAAIHEVAGGGVVVDSSKSVPQAFVLAGTPNVDLSVVHLIRDSRGVAYSWTKRVRRPEVRGGATYMPVYGPARAAAEWTADNLLFQHLGKRRLYRRIRYEGLVGRPQPVVRDILETVGIRSAGMSFIGEDHVFLRPTHSVSGNPMRFRNGRVDLLPDNQWKHGMPLGQRMVVSAVTWPLLAHYGYRPSWW